VRERSPKSHHNFGWEHFTDAVIRKLSEDCSHLVFMLWGAAARAKRELINPNKHLILEAAHPSPLARGAYFGSRHFSQANAYFSQNGKTPINWQLPAHE
jgi:uracil-DNA glycosylase